ncbi:transporter [Actinomycetospora sp.]|uniref:ZIP family metal transporter n=1 Tax=Actinomycetospora sp. TaxID=1872135 RepID=UPI002F408139
MLLRAVLFSLIPVAAAGVSGIVAAIRAPGRRVTSGIQHFAAGVVFAAAAIELLPGVLREQPWVAVVGFSAGIVVMFAFRALSTALERRRRADGPALPVGLAVATGVDFAVDGLVLGAGFAAGPTTGLLLAIALAVEYLFVGLSLSATMARGASRTLTATAPTALSLLTVAGTAVGAVLLADVSAQVLAGVLAFGAVAFMYLATEELLVEAHEQGETALGSVGFFVGFLIYLLLDELIG